MNEQQNVNLNIPMDVKPIYADEVNITAGLKVNVEKQEKGKDIVTKSGNIQLLFFDNATKAVVARIVIDPITAKNLSFGLKVNAEKLMEEIKSDKVPKQVKEQLENSKQPSISKTMNEYIGWTKQ